MVTRVEENSNACAVPTPVLTIRKGDPVISCRHVPFRIPPDCLNLTSNQSTLVCGHTVIFHSPRRRSSRVRGHKSKNDGGPLIKKKNCVLLTADKIFLIEF